VPTQRGFSLLEVAVAAAIAVVLALFCVRAAAAALHALSLQSTRMNEESVVQTLTDRWQADEDTAWAIFTPPSDVSGNANADGHELDFFSRDAKNRSYFWAYAYNANTQTLIRYTYDAPGAAPSLDETFTGITRFYAHTYPLTALQDASSKIYSPLYASATLSDGGVQFYPTNAPWIQGGNTITYVRLETAVNVRELHLSTQTAPSGFTVVLNYTPAPTASPNALSAWPPAAQYPITSGASLPALAYDSRPRTPGAWINALLGGGVALASVAACPAGYARAYNANAAADGWPSSDVLTNARATYGSFSTDASGCFAPQIELHDGGATSFSDGTQSCFYGVVSFGSFSGGNGTVTQSVSPGSTPVASCTLPFTDNTNGASSQVAQLAGCASSSTTAFTLVGIGETCDLGSTGGSSGQPPDCVTQGGGNSGGYYRTDSYAYTVTSGPGTISTTSGDAVLTRTGTGTITVTVTDSFSQQTGCPVKITIGKSTSYLTVSD
jgi:prepilin-type N-terminal cleavage/methylation domain-containing protein